MVLSISLWNEYSSLSHTLALALQGGDVRLAEETMNKLYDVMSKMLESINLDTNNDEQFEGLKI